MSADDLRNVEAGLAALVAAPALVDVVRLTVSGFAAGSLSLRSRVALGVIYGLAYGAAALGGLLLFFDIDFALLLLSTVGAVWWIAYASVSMLRGSENDIGMANDLKWSWSRAATGAVAMMIVVRVFGEIADASFAIFESVDLDDVVRHMRQWLATGWSNPTAFALDFVNTTGAVVSAVAGAALLGFQPAIRDRILRPNQGLIGSLKRSGIGAAAALALLVGSLRGEALESLSAIVYYTLAAAIAFGGLDVIRHLVLRSILAWRRNLPLRAVPLLEQATALVFLRRIGGGYVFMHRLLLEYFADSSGVSRDAMPTAYRIAEPGSKR